MQNGHITSTNPYNFTYSYPEGFNNVVDRPYMIYDYGYFLMPWLIFHSLNNVNLVLINGNDLQKALRNVKITSWLDEHDRNAFGVEHGIIDSTAHYYYLNEWSPRLYHVSPSLYHEFYVIFSSVKTERDDTEVLSIQGLGDLVWVLVALSLFAVSVVSSTIAFRNRTRRASRFASFAESLWIHAADLINNSVACAKKVAAPLRYVRAWWLLGVAFLIQFWCAGLKSDLLADESLIIDSLEDVMSNPKIICYFAPTTRLIKLLEDEDSKYPNLRPQLRRNREVLTNLDDQPNENFVSGKAVAIDASDTLLVNALYEKLKRNKRKLYVGKTKLEEFYVHMYFNKRLPRHIKERIDYV